MSLITRCPACGTMFKVVPDQLRISEGWVRCGQCGEVFDASSHMQPLVRPAATVAMPANPAQPQRWVEPQPEPFIERPDVAGSMVLSTTPTAAPGPTDEELLDAVFRQYRPFPAPVEPVAKVEQVQQVQPLPPAASPLPDADPVPVTADEAASGMASRPGPDSVAEEDVSFVRQARRKAFWRRPLVRVALAIMAVLLTGLLALQVAVHERDRLAALEPALKPWLVRLCAQVGCTVQPLRQIESVVIDSSSFSRLRSDSFRLSFTLRNTAAIEVATPALELTLTDAQDQVLVRRIFQPAEIGAAMALAPRGEWQAAISLSVAAQSAGSPVAGYRLLAFYP